MQQPLRDPVYAHHRNGYPDECVRREDGNLLPGWRQAAGGKTYVCGRRSDAFKLDCAKRLIPPDMQRRHHNARYLDAETELRGLEDWSPEHWISRRESIKLRCELLRYVAEDLKLVIGSESSTMSPPLLADRIVSYVNSNRNDWISHVELGRHVDADLTGEYMVVNEAANVILFAGCSALFVDAVRLLLNDNPRRVGFGPLHPLALLADEDESVCEGASLPPALSADGASPAWATAALLSIAATGATTAVASITGTQPSSRAEPGGNAGRPISNPSSSCPYRPEAFVPQLHGSVSVGKRLGDVMVFFHLVRAESLDLDRLARRQLFRDKIHLDGWSEVDIQRLFFLCLHEKVGAERRSSGRVLARTGIHLQHLT